MKLAFRAVSVIFLMAIGGCGSSSVSLSDTPEWKRSLEITNNVQRSTMQRDAIRKYAKPNEFDEAYWATVIAAGHKLDTKQINQYQYREIVNEAHALRMQRRRMVEAAEDASYHARRAANRSYSCYETNTGVSCY